MTIFLNDPCDRCFNTIGETDDGYRWRCLAFPDGIPNSFDVDDAIRRGECANGYRFEEDESLDIFK